MAELVVETRDVELFCAEADKTLLVEVDLEWTQRGYYHIDAHVPLVTTDEQRVLNILLNNQVRVVSKLPDVVQQEDFTPSTQVRRFTDPHLAFLRLRVMVNELRILVGKNES